MGDHDPTRRRVLEEILATEEKHADDPVSFIEEIENWPPRFPPGRNVTLECVTPE